MSEHLGADSYLYVKTDLSPDPLIIRIAGDYNVNIGDQVFLAPNMKYIHRFDVNGHRQD